MGSLPQHPSLLPSTPRRRIGLAVLASLAAHGLLLLALLFARSPELRTPTRRDILLLPDAPGPVAVEMRWLPPPRGAATPPAAAERTEPEGERQRSAERAPPAARRVPDEAVAARDTAGAGAAAAPAKPSNGRGAAPRGGAPRAAERIGPAYADGRLWARPLPLPPRELAQRLSRSSEQLMDSAVTATVQAFLDSIAADPNRRRDTLPSWTKEVAGKKFGLDANHIYIAGLKIPAAVLALIPLPQGNIDQSRAYNHLQDLRRDLQQAAVRAENQEDFKRAIKEIRERKEREREFERNQRTAPPPENPPTP